MGGSLAHWVNNTIHLVTVQGEIGFFEINSGLMPARIGLVGGLKPPLKNKGSNNGVIMPFLGYFKVNFLFNCGR